MDAFIGSWKIKRDKHENFTSKFGAAFGLSPEQFEGYCKLQYTLQIKNTSDGYTYGICIDGHPEPFVQGPFKMGQAFEFYDAYLKRTGQCFYSLEGSKVVEKTTIKEDPKINWVTHRYIQDGLMVMELTAGGLTCKLFFAKV